MNGEVPSVNGQRLPNGNPSIKPPQPSETKAVRPPENAVSRTPDAYPPKPHMNGVTKSHLVNGGPLRTRDYQNVPEEPLQLVEVDHYLSIATLISRSAQACWNDLYELVEQLSHIEVPAQPVEGPRLPGYNPSANNTTKANLDKKDRILNFANDQKANFIKLMVLLQWSHNVKDVSKTISLNYWLYQQREQYNLACITLYMLKTEATEWQLPNPDIGTAGEVLALGKVPSLPHLGYRPLGKLSKQQILATLRRLNNHLAARLALQEPVPSFFRDYHVHDGRVTFRVENEFEVDLSVLGDNMESHYQMVDIRFLFMPRPSIPEPLRIQLESLTNLELSKNGLLGCYKFLHELTLSNKLTEYYKQALDLSRRQFSGQLRVELLHRNLIVRYWTERPIAKSWIEIGIYSQHKSINDAQPSSSLGVRWFREAKLVEDFEIDLDPQTVSLSSVLAQVAAQHIVHMLDLIYDKLSPTALFSSGALNLEESISYSQPEECSLQIQTTRKSRITLTIDPVTGSMVVSPASEKANRLQLELNRSKNVVEDFVPKFLNFRCAVAESQMLGAARESSWLVLAAFKPTMADLRTAFGPSAARASFFRYPLWSQNYLLAIIYKPTGDSLNLIEMPSGSTALISARIVQTQPIRLSDDLSPTFFEAYAEYASGVVMLDDISRQFQQTSHKHAMATLPDFGPRYVLPAITFIMKQPLELASTSPSIEHMAKVGFVRTEPSRRTGKILVQLKCHAPEDILRQLIASSSNTALKFTSKDRQIAFHLDFDFGRASAANIIQHVKQLTDVISCVQVVERFSWLRLVSLSLQTVVLAYQFGDSAERELKLQFRNASEPAQVEFYPRTSNPHAVLGPAMSQVLHEARTPFASQLETMLVSLSLISPTLVCIDDLQHSKGAEQSLAGLNKVKTHLLVRQPTVIALQFYTTGSQNPEENLVPAKSRLLARFEILPFQNVRPTFVLRPAQEELRSYKRASFASDAMRAKVKELFFQLDDKSNDWARFDNAAVFLADRPKPLLEGIFKLMVEFAQNPSLSIRDEAGTEDSKTNQPPPPATARPNGDAAPKTVPKTPQQGQRNMPNGVNMQRPKPGNKPPMNTQGKEVITLD